MDSQTSMVNDILDSLDDLKITSSPTEEELLKVVELGPKSPKFTSLVATLANEIAGLYSLDERVTPTTDESASENFLFEISSFLSELGCPYSFLTEGEIGSRLKSISHCLSLLLFLVSELQAARMHFSLHPPKSEKTLKGTEVFDQLKCICIALNMAKPPDDIDAARFMSGIVKKVEGQVKMCPQDHLSKPVLDKRLGPVHWEKLEEINEALTKEYETRRSMLLKRLDVTILSFNWSDRAKANLNAIAEAYQAKRRTLHPESSTTMSSLLAAREDISIISKTSHGDTRQACKINQVVMGKVPDRGGRTDEIAAPLPEMPSWQKRQPDSGGRGRGGHQRGGRGGGYQNWGGGGERPGSASRGGGRGGGRGGRGDRPHTGGKRGSGNWGRGRGEDPYGGGSFQRVFSHGGQQMAHGGFASGRHDYRS